VDTLVAAHFGPSPTPTTICRDVQTGTLTAISYKLIFIGESGAPEETRTPGPPVFRFVGTQYKTLSVAYGLRFELASERSVVGRNAPKIENAVALEMAAIA
jgi:hypothetical protein